MPVNKAKSNQVDNYSEQNIEVLEGLQPVRVRPGMYIGSTDAIGLHHCLKEVIDNSVDEAVAGFANEIIITLQKDNSAIVSDNGRGIPVGIKKEYGVSALELVMTKLHAGGKFGGGGYKVSGGLHGVGASVVNALSTECRVEVRQNGKLYYQEYSRGKIKDTVKSVALLKSKFEDKSVAALDRGTTTYFMPDTEIFETIAWDYKTIRSQVRTFAYLSSGLKFKLIDERNDTIESFYFEGGLRSYISSLNRNRDVIHPNICYALKEQEGITVEIAFQYTDTFVPNEQSFANNIKTPEGGTHLTGFRTALTKSINDYGNKVGVFKKDEEKLTGDDSREGLTIAVSIKIPSERLQFEGQTKSKLGTPEARNITESVAKEAIDQFFEENPRDAESIIGKSLLAARARKAARAARDAIIRKGALEGSGLPGKLADCRTKEAARAEIFIVEGDSAGGCFSGDTKVALADGRNISFTELVEEHKTGKQNYCYTIKENGEIGLAPILNPRITKKNAKVMKVILDNDEEVVCTPDHLFMLRDGTYMKAKDLSTSDSLMPLRRKLSELDRRITIEGYELVFNPKHNKWIFTHLLANKLNLKNKVYSIDDGDHRHHVDFNKLNNNPSNINRLTKNDHLTLHAEMAEKTILREDVKEKLRKLRKTPEFREKIRKSMTTPEMRKLLSKRAKKQWEGQGYKEFMAKKFHDFYISNGKYRKQNKERLNLEQKKYWAESENRKSQSIKVSDFFAKNPELKKFLSATAAEQWANSELRLWRSEKTKAQWTDEFRKKRKVSYNQTYLTKALSAMHQISIDKGSINEKNYAELRLNSKDKSLLKYQTISERFFSGDEKAMLEAVQNYNHRIKKILALNQHIDVYDLEVENTHNFALASGIFVHNSAKQARDSEYQAILPIFGKVLNTERARLDQIVKSDKNVIFIKALGTGIGDTFELKNLRYHKIIIMTDADVDGSHIRTLHLTFLFRHMKELVEAGMVYAAVPPLYKATWGKNKKYIIDEAEKDEFEAKMQTSGSKYNISRFKGLGEMNYDELWETTMNPKTRVLKQIQIDDAEEANEVFEMLMGKEVAPRKLFLQANATYADLDLHA